MVGGVLAIGIALGSLTVKTISASQMDNSQDHPSTAYSVNERGQTYGTAVNARTPEERPDLMKAIGEGGVSGYILKKDLEG
ncbi:MAG: hypothetical protein K0Q94_2321 [Paenibacillus sp.]|jgi:hypothetical protein|uniref:hypothetical protein n=1 Tax=Paenibacillus sp. GCM10012303 TaxID=3317340 RepID=UPI0029F123EC|nr:hypothetical protein [Paenibacillus sp.]